MRIGSAPGSGLEDFDFVADFNNDTGGLVAEDHWAREGVVANKAALPARSASALSLCLNRKVRTSESIGFSF